MIPLALQSLSSYLQLLLTQQYAAQLLRQITTLNFSVKDSHSRIHLLKNSKFQLLQQPCIIFTANKSADKNSYIILKKYKMVRLNNYAFEKFTFTDEPRIQSQISTQPSPTQDTHTQSYIVLNRFHSRREQHFNQFDQAIESQRRTRRGDGFFSDLWTLMEPNILLLDRWVTLDAASRNLIIQLSRLERALRLMKDPYTQKFMPWKEQKGSIDGEEVAALIQSLEGQNLVVMQMSRIKKAASRHRVSIVLEREYNPQTKKKIWLKKERKQIYSERADLKTKWKISRGNKFKKGQIRF